MSAAQGSLAGIAPCLPMPSVCMDASTECHRIPDHWKRQDEPVVHCVQWYMDYYGMHMSATTFAAWNKLALCSVDRTRSPTIYVLAEDSPSVTGMANVVNVHKRGVTAQAPLMYNMCDVTGLDFVVHAVLVTQTLTAEALLDACVMIETCEPDSMAFVCSHATHRSVACAVLLAILVYPNARLALSTKRTKRAAIDRGMTTCA